MEDRYRARFSLHVYAGFATDANVSCVISRSTLDNLPASTPAVSVCIGTTGPYCPTA